MKSKVDEVIALAIDFIGNVASTEPDQQVIALERYTEAFGSLVESATFEDDLKDLDLETQQRLAVCHQQMLEFAQSLRNDTERELKELKRKGKGILAYLDHFPQPTSRKPRRKG